MVRWKWRSLYSLRTADESAGSVDIELLRLGGRKERKVLYGMMVGRDEGGRR